MNPSRETFSRRSTTLLPYCKYKRSHFTWPLPPIYHHTRPHLVIRISSTSKVIFPTHRHQTHYARQDSIHGLRSFHCRSVRLHTPAQASRKSFWMSEILTTRHNYTISTAPSTVGPWSNSTMKNTSSSTVDNNSTGDNSNHAINSGHMLSSGAKGITIAALVAGALSLF